MRAQAGTGRRFARLESSVLGGRPLTGLVTEGQSSGRGRLSDPLGPLSPHPEPAALPQPGRARGGDRAIGASDGKRAPRVLALLREPARRRRRRSHAAPQLETGGGRPQRAGGERLGLALKRIRLKRSVGARPSRAAPRLLFARRSAAPSGVTALTFLICTSPIAVRSVPPLRTDGRRHRRNASLIAPVRIPSRSLLRISMRLVLRFA